MNQSVRPLQLGQVGGLKLRYGENVWQGADLYHQMNTTDSLALGNFVLEEGEMPSATNITDLDRGIKTLTHAVAALKMCGDTFPVVALGIKHGNCCGASCLATPIQALQSMLEGDLQAIMGGAVFVNFHIDTDETKVLLHYRSNTRRLLDVIVAPGFSKEARELLRRKAGKCRMISNPALQRIDVSSLDQVLKTRSVRQGCVVQDPDNRVLNLHDPNLQVFGNRNNDHFRDLAFASAICRTSNSNTITLVRDGMLIGQGVGQTRRDRAARLAVMIAHENDHFISHNGTVAVSDSFFPFADGVEALIKAGVDAIFSTSGAVRDAEVQKACVDAGVTLYQLPDSEARMFFGH